MQNFRAPCICCGSRTVDIVRQVNISKLFREISTYTQRLAEIIDDVRYSNSNPSQPPSMYTRHQCAINLDKELRRLFELYTEEKE